MAKKSLNIFLSASIPVVGKAESKYTDTADVIAIRDAIIALASVVLPHYHLVWGGHPSITPLIANVLKHSNKEVYSKVTVYQSGFFVKKFPKENKHVEHVIVTENLGERENSLALMRKEMINENDFAAAVFIGGMHGVEDEYKMFVKAHPKSIVLPIASTGAAALNIFDKSEKNYDSRLKTDMAYVSLFKDLLDI